MPVWEAVEPRARLGVDLGGAVGAELVGRDDELDLLVDALRRSRRDRLDAARHARRRPGHRQEPPRARARPGRGRRADLITWRQGRCLPYGDGVSYWALGEIVKAHAGILESDPADVTEAKLAAILEAVPDEGERAWVDRHLRPLVGLGRVEASGDQRGEAFAAWRRFLEVVAERGPMVLVFEDLHWADDGLLDFVDGLVDWVDGVPLLVVCTARPELLERRAGWGGGKRNATTVSLARAGRRRNCASRPRAARPARARRRDAAGADLACGRQPALCGGVRPHASGRRRGRRAASRDGAGDHRRPDRPAPAGGERPAPDSGRAREGVLVRCAAFHGRGRAPGS